MEQVVNAAFTFPAALFTVLLGVALLFWTSVLLAGADPSMLDGDADVHGVDGGDGGGTDHGDLGDHGDHGDHGAHGGHGVGAMNSLLDFINVGSVPLSLIITVMALVGWLICMGLQLTFAEMLFGMMPPILVAAAILFTGLLGGAIVTRYITRPLKGVFQIEQFIGKENLIDKVCTILTTRVDANFGQASFKTEGAPLVLSVRCKHPNTLTKGSEAVIIAYDEKSNTYEVGALQPHATTAGTDAAAGSSAAQQ